MKKPNKFFHLWLNKSKNYEHFLEVEYKKDFLLLKKMGVIDIKTTALIIRSCNI